MTSKSNPGTPRTVSSTSQYGEQKVAPRQDSVRSSRLGSFIDEEPTFDSQASSETDSQVAPIRQFRPPVAVVWQDLVVESGGGLLRGKKQRILNGVSGYAEPRSVVAVVGPAQAGKSALVNVIGNRAGAYSSVTGSLAINGQAVDESRILPTFMCSTDEPLANVTVEQALIYTALLQMPDKGNGELENEVRQICERLGLLNDLSRSTSSLDLGTKRRLMVACQLICCTSLLVLHDVLLGIHEGDILAILRAVHTLTKEGCTALVVCQQPTTDSCSFFTSAYILVNGEVVYFGDTGTKAVNLLMGAGMPCPPLYSPVEQYMRLVDPSFEVYLQAQGAGGNLADDWNARFSSMMFKVLQGTYQASPLAAQAEQRAALLATASFDPMDDRKSALGAPRQWFVLCRRLVTQGLQGLPLYLGRIIVSIVLALIYGGTYWKLNSSFLGAAERTTVLFIVSAVLPALAIATVPFYANGAQVFVRESKRCQLGLFTHFAALFTLTLPHLAAAAAFSAIAFIPMVDLHSSGAAWGYFIVNATMAHMCADAMVLFVATAVPAFLQIHVCLVLLLVQGLACGFFPGAERGLNLPVSVVSFTSWSYKGLLQNEFKYNDRSYGCPGAGLVEPLSNQGCSLDPTQTYQVLSQGQALLTRSRWTDFYILIGIYGFWTLAYLAALAFRMRTPKLRLSGHITPRVPQEQPVIIDNPLHSSRSQTGEPLNGIGDRNEYEV